MNICVCGLQAHLEVQVAWDCMQKELQRLVTELLGTSASASHSASGNRVVLTKRQPVHSCMMPQICGA